MYLGAFHDGQRPVLLVRFRIAPGHGFLVYLAFRGYVAVHVLADHPQAVFPAAPYKGYPAQTVSLRGISLLVGHKRDGLAPAVWLSMRSAAVSVLSGCQHRPCAGVVYSLSMARTAQHDTQAVALA